ncbi:hypothetical protein [Palleronia abyssalis]|uniref:Uncharacterized protein n=1 Tax=Palleronia abyssalis TaxID=1501240 RepID=A0A2R8BZE4_9RHOB|nr:hypothetical protein [Palleronia abyssalis]SPJ25493.1 hypothetical protein PAA8504_03344 [Palleronia abyssalis]
MGTIVTFPHARHEPADDLSFVSDGEILDFDNDCADIHLAPRLPDQDWTNQELADLYRVKYLLEQADIATETERGTSDEGDPWFIFMRPDGEVFIHFCRIDAIYYLDSPSLETAIRGADFRALVADYTRKIMGARTDGHERHGNVVSLRAGGGQISLHPAAMLAALVWSLVLGAEDLVALPLSAGAHPEDTGATDDVVMPRAARVQPAEDVSDSTPGPDDAAGWVSPQSTFSLRDPWHISLNGYATGLSAVAIGIGVLSDRGLGLLQDTPLEQVFLQLEALATPGTSSPSGTGLPDTRDDVARIDPIDILIDISRHPENSDPREAGNTANADMPLPGNIGQSAAPSQLPPASDVVLPNAANPPWHASAPEDMGLSREGSSFVRKAVGAAAPADPAPQAVNASSAAPQVAGPAQNGGAGGPFIEMTSAKPAASVFSTYTSSLDLSTFTLGKTVYYASFEVTEDLLEKFGLLKSDAGKEYGAIPGTGHPDVSAEVSQVFADMTNGAAKTTIHTLLEQDVDLEIADSGAWLWVVEAEAQYAPLAETMSMTYEMDDGSKVMITGLQSTFADLDAGLG